MNDFTATIAARIRVASAEFDNENGDFQRIRDFLHSHPHEYVAMRADSVVEEAFDQGNVLLVEVPDGEDGWIIEGCAFRL